MSFLVTVYVLFGRLLHSIDYQLNPVFCYAFEHTMLLVSRTGNIVHIYYSY